VLEVDLRKISFVLSEMDGVVTEHMSGIGEIGITLFKSYYMKDFEAINLIKRDFGFAFLSKEAEINMSLCKKKNIPFFFAERNKEELYKKILMRYNLSVENVLYVGSSYSDIECMRRSGLSVCPEDAVVPVKLSADHIVSEIGGTGVLCAIYELLRPEIQNRMAKDNG
jgi:3-deoxy-D-manno-octulosonate 8-phosphate phosphatase (KDO 8-P phosphatase)